MSKLEVEKSITINGITFHFSDCKTPKEAMNYLHLMTYVESHQPGIIAGGGW